MTVPHPVKSAISLNCAVITVSDTRSVETDNSGRIIQQLLIDAGHQIVAYTIVKDEAQQIKAWLSKVDSDAGLDTIILNGGTGIAPRDLTYEVVSDWLETTLPGFGELFRWLSYQEIGSRAIASRAIAGVKQRQLIFALPGSSNAVRLAMTQLILPELNHLVRQLRS
ncbi:MogA/MoaB family molybdenum cofactor biosynthesis protein [Myxosarcina sp. GI1(2024)]